MKAILVFDMPMSCHDCPCSDHNMCFKVAKTLDVGWRKERPSWCPLKPMPMEREPKEEWFNEYHRDEFADGWNAFLKELEK